MAALVIFMGKIALKFLERDNFLQKSRKKVMSMNLTLN